MKFTIVIASVLLFVACAQASVIPIGPTVLTSHGLVVSHPAVVALPPAKSVAIHAAAVPVVSHSIIAGHPALVAAHPHTVLVG